MPNIQSELKLSRNYRPVAKLFDSIEFTDLVNHFCTVVVGCLCKFLRQKSTRLQKFPIPSIRSSLFPTIELFHRPEPSHTHAEDPTMVPTLDIYFHCFGYWQIMRKKFFLAHTPNWTAFSFILWRNKARTLHRTEPERILNGPASERMLNFAEKKKWKKKKPNPQ